MIVYYFLNIKNVFYVLRKWKRAIRQEENINIFLLKTMFFSRKSNRCDCDKYTESSLIFNNSPEILGDPSRNIAPARSRSRRRRVITVTPTIIVVVAVGYYYYYHHYNCYYYCNMCFIVITCETRESAETLFSSAYAPPGIDLAEFMNRDSAPPTYKSLSVIRWLDPGPRRTLCDYFLGGPAFGTMPPRPVRVLSSRGTPQLSH